MTVLALDVGEKRIGVALSDPTDLLAMPLTVIERDSTRSGVDEVLRLAADHDAVEIVVGLPLSLSGRVGPQAARVKRFAEQLSARGAITVKQQDERFSSIQAERLLRDSGVTPSRDKPRVDMAAATVILQSYLDSKRTGI